MALAMHTPILPERGFANSATDELLKRSNQLLLQLPSGLLTLSLGLPLSVLAALPGGAMMSYWSPATAFERSGRPMLRIEKESDGHIMSLRLSGRIQSANIGNIQAQVDDDSVRILLDLGEVTLVDVEVVRSLSDCENDFASEPKAHRRRFRIEPDSFVYVRTIEQGDVGTGSRISCSPRSHSKKYAPVW
jgi:hypothetical protein